MTGVDPNTGEILDAMTAAESRIGIVPLSELLPRRAGLVNKVCDLRARFGPFGTFDHLRKIELSRIKALIRAQATRDKRKISASEIDDEAHGHPDYFDFITAATLKRAEWVKLESQIEAIEMTINRGQAVARFASAETFLTPRTG